jgi:AcrR family transcriptional regulator
MPAEDRRAALVEAALPLLRERGLAVSTREIAEAAGVAEGTVFRAFGSKEELVQACAAAVFDTAGVLDRLAAIDRAQPLDDRLVEAVTVLQHHLGQLVGLMATLRATGMAPPRSHSDHTLRGRRMTDPEIDAAVVDVIGADATTLRLPVEDVVNLLAHLTLSSVHPLFPARHITSAEIVSVVLDGTRKVR